MIALNLRDEMLKENFKAISQLRKSGMYSDEELQRMYEKQVQEDKKEKIRICRYDKDANPDTCGGCEYGCLEKAPAAYINRDFEDEVKEMIKGDRCRGNKKAESQEPKV